jgi:hypothetical protein
VIHELQRRDVIAGRNPALRVARESHRAAADLWSQESNRWNEGEGQPA